MNAHLAPKDDSPAALTHASRAARGVAGWTLGLGLVGAPTLFLCHLQLAYAMVPWACANQAHWTLHVVAAGAFALALSLTALCVINWRKTNERGRASDSADPSVRDAFLAVMGALISGYCSLAIAAQWATQLVLSPCVL